MCLSILISCMKLRSGRKMVDPRTPERDQNLGGNTNMEASVGSILMVMSSTEPNIVTTTQPVTTRPPMVTTSGKYVLNFARDTHEYGMPTMMLARLYNSSPTFG